MGVGGKEGTRAKGRDFRGTGLNARPRLTVLAVDYGSVLQRAPCQPAGYALSLS
jgi:hypothetical protein